MSHTCKALIITCMDFRLVDQTKKWLDEQNLRNDYDLISVAGASKEITNPSDEKNREFLLKSIGVSCDLHSASKIVLIHHSDCGAYGGKQAFSSAEEERETHEQDMQKSAAIIGEKYPGLDISKVYAIIKEDGEIEFKKVV